MIPGLHWTGEPFPNPTESLHEVCPCLHWTGESFPHPNLSFYNL